jgi:hypothetical protein
LRQRSGIRLVRPRGVRASVDPRGPGPDGHYNSQAAVRPSLVSASIKATLTFFADSPIIQIVAGDPLGNSAAVRQRQGPVHRDKYLGQVLDSDPLSFAAVSASPLSNSRLRENIA